MKHKLMLIEWLDSAQPVGSWHHLDDLPANEVINCVSVGWVVSSNKKMIMLAQNLGDYEGGGNAQASGLMRIPKSCVTRKVELATS